MLGTFGWFYGTQEDAALPSSILSNFVSSRPDLYSAPEPTYTSFSTFMEMHGPDTDPVGGTGFLSTRLI